MKAARLVLAMVLFVVAVPQASAAQSFVEVGVEGTLTAKLNLEKGFSEKDGVYVWALTTREWSEVLAGIWVKPNSWLKFSLGFGLETADQPLRYGLTTWLGNERLSSLTVFEVGASGSWYKHTTTVTWRRARIGVISQKYIGTGPLVEIALPKQFGISAALAHNGRRITPVVGLSKSF